MKILNSNLPVFALPVMVGAIVLGACDVSDQEDTIGEPVEIQTVAEQDELTDGNIVIRQDDEKALQAAFRTAYGQASPFTRMTDVGRFTITPGGLYRTDFATILISEVRMDNGCHACSGGLDIHYMQPKGEGFAPKSAYIEAIEGSEWGRSPEKWSVSGKFGERPVLFSRRGGTAQGYSCAFGTLHELTVEGPKKIADFPLYYSNSGAIVEGQPTEIEGRIANIEKGEGFDIIYSGSENFTDHYVRKDAQYVLEGKSRMEGC